MTIKRLNVSTEDGLQPKAAALLVQVASKYTSSILLEQGSKRVNAKSIMGVLSLKLRRGDTLLLAVSGDDEDEAAESIAQLIEKGEAKQ